MNNAEVVADFSRRWANTYVWMYMEQLGREVLVKITSVEEHPKKVATINVMAQEYGSFRINFGSETSSLKFKYPPVGVFQSGVDALMLQRRPARQWRRGLCADNATVMPTHRWITGKQVQWSLKVVQDAYDHKVLTVNEALLQLNKKKARSVALPHAFSLMLSPTVVHKGHLLLHWGEPVAEVAIEDGKIMAILQKDYTGIVESLYDNSK